MNVTIPRRPKVSLKLSPYETKLEVFGAILLVIYWVYTLYLYNTITGSVPVHFDSNLNPDAFGDKSALLAKPKLATIFYVLLTVVSFFPRYFNYTVEITPENAEAEYRKGANIIRYLKITIVLIFILLSWLVVYTIN